MVVMMAQNLKHSLLKHNIWFLCVEKAHGVAVTCRHFTPSRVGTHTLGGCRIVDCIGRAVACKKTVYLRHVALWVKHKARQKYNPYHDDGQYKQHNFQHSSLFGDAAPTVRIGVGTCRNCRAC